MERFTEYYNTKIYKRLNESLLAALAGLLLNRTTRTKMSEFRHMVRQDPELQVQLDALLKNSRELTRLVDNYCERHPDSPLCKQPNYLKRHAER